MYFNASCSESKQYSAGNLSQSTAHISRPKTNGTSLASTCSRPIAHPSLIDINRLGGPGINQLFGYLRAVKVDRWPLLALLRPRAPLFAVPRGPYLRDQRGEPPLLDDRQEPLRRAGGALHASLPIPGQVLRDGEVVREDRLGDLITLPDPPALAPRGLWQGRQAGPLELAHGALVD